jgi:membrane peptidoglycan carboxypeptidase
VLLAVGPAGLASFVAFAGARTRRGIERLRELTVRHVRACCCPPTARRWRRFTRAQHEPVPLARVSPHVVQALLATEDQRFYEHRHRRYAHRGALWHTLTGETQGGSTITQQLARNLFPTTSAARAR